MLVSCLCVTKDRPEFMPWLRWNFDRLSYEHKELVLVDGSAEPDWAPLDGVPGIRLRQPGCNIPRARNLAIELANGETCIWMDDDDWQRPDRIELSLEQKKLPVLGGWSYFLNVDTFRVRRYVWSGWFNSMMFRRSVQQPFREELETEEDGPWMRANFGDTCHRLDKCLTFWLSHHKNRCNPASKGQFRKSVDEIKKDVGLKLWGDTDEQLRALVDRIARA